MHSRRALLATIHIAKKDLGLDDETYRCMIASVANGKTSAAHCTLAELHAIVQHFESKGWARKQEPKPKLDRKKIKQPKDGQSRKIVALWITLYYLGGVDDRSDAALGKWVRRQTGRDHLLFCSAREKHALIDALNQWLDRIDIKQYGRTIMSMWRDYKAFGLADDDSWGALDSFIAEKPTYPNRLRTCSGAQRLDLIRLMADELQRARRRAARTP